MTRDPAALAAAAASAHVWPPVLAIDPGARWTGIVLRTGRDALEGVTVEGAKDHGEHRQRGTYAFDVIETAREIIRRNRDRLNAEAVRRGVDPGGLRHAVETFTNPKTVRANGNRVALAEDVLLGAIGASTTYGTVIGTWPGSILVAPLGGEDGGWETAWTKESGPRSLWHKAPRGWLPGGVDRSHQRSAWAIAGAAHALAAPPLKDQAQAAAAHAAAHEPNTDPEDLVPLLRRSVAETDGWDLLERLPALARTVIAASHGRDAGDAAAAAVEAYLTEIEEGDGHE